MRVGVGDGMRSKVELLRFAVGGRRGLSAVFGVVKEWGKGRLFVEQDKASAVQCRRSVVFSNVLTAFPPLESILVGQLYSTAKIASERVVPRLHFERFRHARRPVLAMLGPVIAVALLVALGRQSLACAFHSPTAPRRQEFTDSFPEYPSIPRRARWRLPTGLDRTGRTGSRFPLERRLPRQSRAGRKNNWSPSRRHFGSAARLGFRRRTSVRRQRSRGARQRRTTTATCALGQAPGRAGRSLAVRFP